MVSLCSDIMQSKPFYFRRSFVFAQITAASGAFCLQHGHIWALFDVLRVLSDVIMQRCRVVMGLNRCQLESTRTVPPDCCNSSTLLCSQACRTGTLQSPNTSCANWGWGEAAALAVFLFWLCPVVQVLCANFHIEI